MQLWTTEANSSNIFLLSEEISNVLTENRQPVNQYEESSKEFHIVWLT
jgi:hypothetical protein